MGWRWGEGRGRAGGRRLINEAAEPAAHGDATEKRKRIQLWEKWRGQAKSDETLGGDGGGDRRGGGAYKKKFVVAANNKKRGNFEDFVKETEKGSECVCVFWCILCSCLRAFFFFFPPLLFITCLIIFLNFHLMFVIVMVTQIIRTKNK